MHRDDAYVLVADDDPLVLKSIEFILGRAGFHMRTVTDGAEALATARRDPPAVALLDVMMPELNGLEVCRAMKADPALAQVPVFLVTARAMSAERRLGLDAGADAYVTKPFVNSELVELVRGVFDPSRT
ncbi:MAG TPA: response regulator [Candidatus Krumholzibacteria bacterium]|nr:response regulator [Candidatus Krumholzibacteria bacterium]